MRTGTIAFFLGLLILTRVPELPPPACVLLLPLGLLTAFRFPRLRLPALCMAGFAWGLLRAGLALSPGLAPELEGLDLEVEATIASVPKRVSRGLRFDADVHRLRQAGRERPSPGRVRLTWYTDPPALAAGERWRFSVRLKRPHGFSNPGGKDYEGRLFRQGIRATGYVRQRQPQQRLARAGASLNGLRQGLAADIGRHLEGSRHAAVIKALAVGLRDDMRARDWEVLRATGTNHLMAISGLHIGLVAGMVFWLARAVWSRSSRALLLLPAQRFGALAALPAALAYAALAGFSIPTQRALVMLAAVMLSVLFPAHVPAGRQLALALLCVLLLDPLAVLAPGFWLSFGAVAVILFGVVGRTDRRGLWARWGRVQWLVAIGLAPLLLAFFGEMPLLSPLANLVAVPWTGMLVVPLVLAGSLLLGLLPALGASLLAAAELAVHGLWLWLEWLAGLDWVYRAGSDPAPLSLAAGLVGALLLLAPRGVPGRRLAVLWFLPLLLAPGERLAPGTARFTLLDVGQGLSAVVQTRDHVLVYDTGPRYGAHFDAGRAVLVPFLLARGVKRVDVLVLSHSDIDHVGGSDYLFAALPVARVFASEPGSRDAMERCRQGHGWRWDGVRFEFLHPRDGLDLDGNDGSCVLRVATGDDSILLAGDVEAAGERALVDAYGETLAAAILVAPHHGSATSSGEALLAAVRPRHALFSYGHRNRFGFPDPAVAERYRRAGASLHDTARRGAIEFLLDGAPGLAPPSYHRDVARRFWHDRP